MLAFTCPPTYLFSSPHTRHHALPHHTLIFTCLTTPVPTCLNLYPFSLPVSLHTHLSQLPYYILVNFTCLTTPTHPFFIILLTHLTLHINLDLFMSFVTIKTLLIPSPSSLTHTMKACTDTQAHKYTQKRCREHTQHRYTATQTQTKHNTDFPLPPLLPCHLLPNSFPSL